MPTGNAQQNQVAIVQHWHVHPANPQKRCIEAAQAMIDRGGIVVLPTDCTYALVVRVGAKAAEQRLRLIRGLAAAHPLTLMCRSIGEISAYAQLDTAQYRVIRKYTPGPYTFILKATREVPKRLHYRGRNSIALRIPDHAVSLAMLEAAGAPLLSTTLRLPDDKEPMHASGDIVDRMKNRVDGFLDAGNCELLPSTVIDLSEGTPEMVRQGRGQPI